MDEITDMVETSQEHVGPGLSPRQSGLDDATRPAAELFLDYAPLLRRIATRKFDVPADEADSLVQDVFLSYLADPSRVRVNTRSYLIGAICNASRYWRRSRTSESRVFEPAEGAAEPITDDLFDGLAQNLAVAATLSKLEPRCREALRRYYLDQEDTPEIAAALNTSRGNVNYIMHICRQKARLAYREIAELHHERERPR
jgi:RNA polymerase sigma factor (sigma-70 family)